MRIDAIFKFYYKTHRHGTPERSNSSLDQSFEKIEGNFEKIEGEAEKLNLHFLLLASTLHQQIRSGCEFKLNIKPYIRKISE